MTFHIEKIGDPEFQRFAEAFQRKNDNILQEEKINKKNQNQFKTAFKPKKRNAWLVKPGENTNRGAGI